MSKPDSHVPDQSIRLPNTYQPGSRTYQPNQLLTETYQPVGEVQVPTEFPPLISGVAPAPTPAPQAPVASANGESK
jgi:hypothetical protein